MRRTRIVTTVGPATSDPAMLRRLVDAGADVTRINSAHGSQEGHARVIEGVRAAAEQAGRPVAVLQDLAGPKVRTGPLASGRAVLEPGAAFTLTSRAVPGDETLVSLTYRALPEDVEAGDTLLLADGAIELLVESTSAEDIVCRVVVGGELGSHKGINVPARSLRAPLLSEKDRADLAFGLSHGVDYIAISFVQSADDVRAVRALVEEQNGDAALIAKIEKRAALDAIDPILSEVDGLMIARGDLGVEIPIEEIPKTQKMLIARANQAGKPVITATQMLKSMVESPRPTRAEVTDVANAVLDGTDAVMLSEETAIGRYPVESVRMMARIAEETETVFPFDTWSSGLTVDRPSTAGSAVADAACRMASKTEAAAIVSFTQSGATARLVARHRPSQPVIALTPEPPTYRKLSLVWGVVPVLTDAAEGIAEVTELAVQVAVESGIVDRGRPIVITAGHPLPVRGTTNLIKIAGT